MMRVLEVVRSCMLPHQFCQHCVSGFANLVQAGSNEFLVQLHCNCTGTLKLLGFFLLYYIMLVISDIKAEISIRISLQLQVIFSSVSYIFLDDLKYYAYNFKFKQ